MNQNPYEPPVMAEVVEPVRRVEPVARRFRFPWTAGWSVAWGPLIILFGFGLGHRYEPSDNLYSVAAMFGLCATVALLALRILAVAIHR